MEEIIINCEKAMKLRVLMAELNNAIASPDYSERHSEYLHQLEQEIAQLEEEVVTRRKFTQAEIDTRLAEIAKGEKDEKASQLKQAKEALIKAAVELQQADVLRTQGDLEIADVAEKQAALMAARARLKELTKSG